MDEEKLVTGHGEEQDDQFECSEDIKTVEDEEKIEEAKQSDEYEIEHDQKEGEANELHQVKEEIEHFQEEEYEINEPDQYKEGKEKIEEIEQYNEKEVDQITQQSEEEIEVHYNDYDSKSLEKGIEESKTFTCSNDFVANPRAQRILKIAEHEELNLQVLFSRGVEYKHKVQSMESDIVRYRGELSRLLHDYASLKAEHEHVVERKSSAYKELYHKLEMEKEEHQKQMHSLREEIGKKNSEELHEITSLQKDNTELKLLVKNLKEKIKAMKKKIEHGQAQAGQEIESLVQQLSELSRQCSTLQTENEAAQLQLDHAQKEQEDFVGEKEKIRVKLHHKERANLKIRGDMEELSHHHRVEMNNLKLHFAQQQCELEKQNNDLQMEVALLKSKGAVQDSSLADLNKQVEEKEVEVKIKVQEMTVMKENAGTLEEIVLDLKKQIEEKEAEMKKKIQETTSLVDKVNQQESNISHLKKEMDKREKGTKRKVQVVREEERNKLVKTEREKAQLETQLSSLIQHKSTIEREITTLQVELKQQKKAEPTYEREIQCVKNQLHEEKKISDNLKAELQTQEEAKATLELGHFQLKERYEQLLRTHEMELEETRFHLTQSQYQLEEENGLLQQEMKALVTKATAHETSILELKKNMKEKEEELITRVQNVRGEQRCVTKKLECEKVKLESQLMATRQQNVNVQATYNKTIQEQTKAVQSSQAEMKKKYDSETVNLRNQLKRDHETLSRIQSEFEIQRKSMSKMEAERVQLEERIKELTQTKSKMEAENSQLKRHIEEFVENRQIEVNNLKIDLTQENCNLQKENTHLQVEVNTIRNKMIIQEALIADLKRDLEQKENTLKGIETAHAMDDNRINEFESDKAHLESQLTSLKAEVADIQNAHTFLQTQMQDNRKAEEEAKEKHENEKQDLENELIREQRRSTNFKIEIKKITENRSATAKEKSQLKNDMEELLRSQKTDMDIIKVEAAQQRYTLKENQDRLQLELDMLKSKAKTQESIILDLREDLEQKETTLKHVQAVRGEELGRMNELECDKFLLRTRVSSLEQIAQQSATQSDNRSRRSSLDLVSQRQRVREEREIYLDKKKTSTELKTEIQPTVDIPWHQKTLLEKQKELRKQQSTLDFERLADITSHKNRVTKKQRELRHIQDVIRAPAGGLGNKSNTNFVDLEKQRKELYSKYFPLS